MHLITFNGKWRYYIIIIIIRNSKGGRVERVRTYGYYLDRCFVQKC